MTTDQPAVTPDPNEFTFKAAERLVNQELVDVVVTSSQQNTDLDMCGARHAIMARNIAEDVLEYLLTQGWTPPGEVPVTSAEVPEGQVHRDEKFWNTFHAVLAEQEEAYARRKCQAAGHPELTYRTDGVPECQRCGMSGDELLLSAGFVKQGDVWVNEAGPLPQPLRFTADD